MSTPRPSLVFRKKGFLNVSLDRLSLELGLDDWDFLLVGDGSGVSWEMGAGWACVVVGRIPGIRPIRKVIGGGWSDGTVNIAELSAYMQALHFIDANHAELAKEKLNRNLLRVAILTDSEVVAKSYQNGQTYSGPLAPLWAAIRVFETRGYVLQFRHIPRISIALNWVADKLASGFRVAAQNSAKVPLARRGLIQDLADLNPG